MASSWICETKLNWLQRFSVRVMQCGPIPHHIAFIMDGNRRFAEKHNLKSKTEGHVKGFDKLVEVMQWCFNVGVKEVTLYAFSIENFKRNREEVDTLMQMAREKFQQLLEDKDKLMEQGVCVRIVGNLTLLPIDLQSLMAKIILMTRNNDRFMWNIAIAYTSRDEMSEAVRTIVNGVQQSELNVDHISDNLFRRCTYMKETTDPDLIVRTSGETRLSDFLMYQQHKMGMTNARRCLDSYVENASITYDEKATQQIESFINKIEVRQTRYLEDLIKVDP